MEVRQSGNVLFLILIAVALFAALSYVVTSSSRTSSGSTEKEANKLGIASIEQQVSAVRSGVTRMLIGGIPLERLDFSHPGRLAWNNTTYNTANPNCVTNACKVFSPGDGAIPWLSFERYWSGIAPTGGVKGGHDIFKLMCIKNVGSDLPEVVMIIRHTDNKICAMHNEKFNVTYPANETHTELDFSGAALGTQLATSCTNSLGDTIPSFAGKSTFCYCGVDGNCSLVYTIVER